MKYLRHIFHKPAKSVVIAKTYRPFSEYHGEGCLYEITIILHQCECCGYTWTTTLQGKEVEIKSNDA